MAIYQKRVTHTHTHRERDSLTQPEISTNLRARPSDAPKMLAIKFVWADVYLKQEAGTKQITTGVLLACDCVCVCVCSSSHVNKGVQSQLTEAPVLTICRRMRFLINALGATK